MTGTAQLQPMAADRSRAEATALACLEASPFVEDKPWRFSWFDSPYSLFSEGLGRAHREQAEEEPVTDGWFHCRLCRADLNVTAVLDPYLIGGDSTMDGVGITQAHCVALRGLLADLDRDFWANAPWAEPWVGCREPTLPAGLFDLLDRTRMRPASVPHGFGNTWLAAQLDHDPEPSTRGARRRRWLQHYRELAAEVGWWVVIGDSVLLVPKPDSTSCDAEGNLHGLDEPAVVYPDGWGFHAFHGHAVPQWSGDPDESTLRRILTVPDPELRSSMLELVTDQALEESGVVELILDETDSQVRQALISRFGIDRLVALVGARWVLTTSDAEFRLSMLDLLDDKTVEEAGVADLVLHETNAEVRQRLLARFGPDRVAAALGARQLVKDRFGELWLVPAQIETIPSNSPYRQDRLVELMGPMKFVKVVDATPRPDGTPTYWLPVPMEMTSAREAVAWTFGLSKYEYRPEVET